MFIILQIEEHPGTAVLATGRWVKWNGVWLISTRNNLFFPNRLQFSVHVVSPDSMEKALNVTGTWAKAFTRLHLLKKKKKGKKKVDCLVFNIVVFHKICISVMCVP